MPPVRCRSLKWLPWEEVSMMDGSLVMILVSTGAAVLNGIVLLMTWMKYRKLAYESLIFAVVIGALPRGDYPS
jgi:hypothetical protein